MATPQAVKIDKPYKKIQRIGTTSEIKPWYLEAIKSEMAVKPDRVMKEYGLVPALPPVVLTGATIPNQQYDTNSVAVADGVVKMVSVTLNSVAGNGDNAFHSDDIIDLITSYVYKQGWVLKKSNGDIIEFGDGDWEVDTDAGIVVFFTGSPSGVSAGSPIVVEGYVYSGAYGVGGDGISSTDELTEGATNKYFPSNGLTQLDIVNDLTTGGTDKVASAEQLKVLKTMFDSFSRVDRAYADIAARDALVSSPTVDDPAPSDQETIFITDASADPDVDSGWATYKWIEGSSQWVKTAEQEGIDLDLSNFFDVTTMTSDDITEGGTHLFMTAAERSALDKLKPVAPEDITGKTLELGSRYTAVETATDDTKAHVTDNTTPTISMNPYTIAGGFLKVVGNTVSALLNAAGVGSRELTSNNDSGTYGALTLLDGDFHAGVDGKANFYNAIAARVIVQNALTSKINTLKILDEAAESQEYTFYVDDSAVATLTGLSADALDTPIVISGVPCYTNGDRFRVQATINNAIKRFYNSTRIGRASAAVTNAINGALGSSYSEGDPYLLDVNISVQNNQEASALVVSVTAYNAKGTAYSESINTSYRIDSKSDESGRLEAGTTQYPSSGYGMAYTSSTQLSTSGNEALQLAFGKYFFDQSYGGLTGVNIGGAEYRWTLFKLPSQSGITAVNCQFSSTSGFSAGVMAGFILQVRVDGASGTNGWVDGNAIFSPGSTPTNNGDAALDPSSTNTLKIVVFGASPKVGDVFVRVGLASGSGLSFGQNLALSAS